MPGFLGTEKQFNDRFSKPILAMKNLSAKITGSDGKKSKVDASKIQEAGQAALEQLHRQVLPFLLRRMKEDVLHDLPPKIIQDYCCEMSPLQRHLYDRFVESQVKHIEGETSSSESKTAGGHIFQALQFMRKLCNHPALVVSESHPEYQYVMNQVREDQTTLDDIRYAPKLQALAELLQQCGIGVNLEQSEHRAISPHRALLFCQMKTMLDIIEFQLFKKNMPSISYLRMDGSTNVHKRHEIVNRFNADPSIDVLLLTTSVGGLGLNLTGADTVIFVEHDW